MRPVFSGVALEISDELFASMQGASWHPAPECPARPALRLLSMNHWGMDGRVHEGELVVAATVADELLAVFARMFAARFPIFQMVRIDAFGGDDNASMAANNCSAFNFRRIAGTSKLSQHALGVAVDINPVQNPWIRNDTVLPPKGRDFLDRSDVRAGMIVRPGPVTDAFDAIGWHWGGDWNDTKDYHHFSKYDR